MQIEVGKFYKTRSGHKVRIYAVDGLVPVHGALLRDKNQWINMQWCLNGRVFKDSEDGLDIISDWNNFEEIGKPCAWIDSAGYVRMLPYESLVIQNSWRRAFWMDEK